MQQHLTRPPLDYPIEATCVDPGVTPKAPPFWPRWSSLRPVDLILLGSILGTGIAGLWVGICIRAAQ